MRKRTLAAGADAPCEMLLSRTPCSGREKLRTILLDAGNGHLFRGWRHELDPDGLLEVSFQSFCSFAAVHGLAVDVRALFGQDKSQGSLALSGLCPKTGNFVERLQRWVKRNFGGPVELLLALDKESEGRVDIEDVLQAFQSFQGSEEDPAALAGYMDVHGIGSVTRDDLLWLECDEQVRKQAVNKLRLSRNEQQQQVLASACYSEEQRRLPPTHRLATRPWQAQAFEKLPMIVHERRGRWRGEILRRGQESMELFHAHLREACGNLVRAWRTKLDPENTSSLVYAGLKRYCSKAGAHFDVGSLWTSLDADADGVVGLESLCPEAAEVLASFRLWAHKTSGSCTCLWDQPVMIDARSIPQRGGRWRSDKKMLISPFISGLKDIGWRTPSARRTQNSGSAETLLFNSLDFHGCGFVQQSDLSWLDAWTPVEWLTAEPDEEEWIIMKALLVRLEGHPLRAWRRRLDTNDSNGVSWAEFRKAFQDINFRGNLAGAWRHVDHDMSGVISMKEYDAQSSQILSSFKSWCEANFGSVELAFKGLDLDGSRSISLSELRRACEKRCWDGDVKLLFKCLDVDTAQDEGTGRRTITFDEISFLDHWQAGEPSLDVSCEKSESDPCSSRKSKRASGLSAPPPKDRQTAATAMPRSSSSRSLPGPKRSHSASEALTAAQQTPSSCRQRPESSPRREPRWLLNEVMAGLRRPPQPPSRVQAKPPPGHDREERIRAKEQKQQGIYEALSSVGASSGRSSSSSAVTQRLYQKPKAAATGDGYPTSRRHELGPARIPSLPKDDSGRLARSRSCAPVLTEAAAREEDETSGLGSKFMASSDLDLVYRFGSQGKVVAPFSLEELNLNPLGGENFSRGTGARS